MENRITKLEMQRAVTLLIKQNIQSEEAEILNVEDRTEFDIIMNKATHMERTVIALSADGFNKLSIKKQNLWKMINLPPVNEIGG